MLSFEPCHWIHRNLPGALSYDYLQKPHIPISYPHRILQNDEKREGGKVCGKLRI